MAILLNLDLWVCLGVIICCLVAYIRSKYPLLPYSGCVIVLGLTIRLLAGQVVDIGQSFDGETDEEVIEFIFLPALIAECALSLDSHVVLRHLFFTPSPE